MGGVSDRPPPEGRLLFRFKGPTMTDMGRDISQVYEEYAVTGHDEDPNWEGMPDCSKLIIWGWLWGAVGVLLAVPLLVCVKLIAGQMNILPSWVRLIETKA